MRHLSENEIQQYMDGTISSEKQAFITHLDSCQLCQSRVKQYQLLYGQLAADEPGQLSPDFSKSVMTKIMAESVESTVNNRRSVWSLALSFTGIVLSLMTILYFVNMTAFLESIKIPGIQEYFNRILISKIEKLTGFLDVDISMIIYAGLTLIIIAAVDYIIRHSKRRPISFLV